MFKLLVPNFDIILALPTWTSGSISVGFAQKYLLWNCYWNSFHGRPLVIDDSATRHQHRRVVFSFTPVFNVFFQGRVFFSESHNGCGPLPQPPDTETKWFALLQRYGCKFDEKVRVCPGDIYQNQNNVSPLQCIVPLWNSNWWRYWNKLGTLKKVAPSHIYTC